MSRKTVIRDSWEMLRNGLIPDNHKEMVVAEIKFLESLSPKSSRALDRVYWTQREAYLKEPPERRAQMVVTRWGDFLYAMLNIRVANVRSSEIQARHSSADDYTYLAPVVSQCPCCRRRLTGLTRSKGLQRKKSNPKDRRDTCD